MKANSPTLNCLEHGTVRSDVLPGVCYWGVLCEAGTILNPVVLKPDHFGAADFGIGGILGGYAIILFVWEEVITW